ncbi:MAG: hypothetical protein ABIE36_02615 [Candidatus Diapherotrites archaeon]
MMEIIYIILFIVDFILICMIISIILNQNRKQENQKAEKKLDVISLFHHIHHYGESVLKHEVHHCGGEHVKINPSLNYTITHCKCNKHKIDVKKAIGHDFMSKKVLVVFEEKCPEGGWHVESGRIKNDN